MPRQRHYSPTIERFLVSVLYHEARHQKLPMTTLANAIIKEALTDSVGWKLASQALAAPVSQPVVSNIRVARERDLQARS